MTSYLAEDLRLPVIIGPSGSAQVDTAIKQPKIQIRLPPSATSPSLQTLILASCRFDDVQARVLANVVLQNIELQGLENEVYVVYEGNTYGQNFISR